MASVIQTQKIQLPAIRQDFTRNQAGVEDLFKLVNSMAISIDSLINLRVLGSLYIPPTSPNVGDAYLISPSGTPTGAWAGLPVDTVVIWNYDQTENLQWQAIKPWTGMMVYDDFITQKFVKVYTGSGGWTVVNVSSAYRRVCYPTIPISTPPTTPTTLVAYLLSPTPTGVWSGYGNYIALWNGGSWEFHPPLLGSMYSFNDFSGNMGVAIMQTSSSWKVIKFAKPGPTALSGSATLTDVINKINEWRTFWITNGFVT